jgi:hypothetical protein
MHHIRVVGTDGKVRRLHSSSYDPFPFQISQQSADRRRVSCKESQLQDRHTLSLRSKVDEGRQSRSTKIYQRPESNRVVLPELATIRTQIQFSVSLILVVLALNFTFARSHFTLTSIRRKGSIWDRSGIDPGPIQVRSGIDLGLI